MVGGGTAKGPQSSRAVFLAGLWPFTACPSSAGRSSHRDRAGPRVQRGGAAARGHPGTATPALPRPAAGSSAPAPRLFQCILAPACHREDTGGQKHTPPRPKSQPTSRLGNSVGARGSPHPVVPLHRTPGLDGPQRGGKIGMGI